MKSLFGAFLFLGVFSLAFQPGVALAAESGWVMLEGQERELIVDIVDGVGTIKIGPDFFLIEKLVPIDGDIYMADATEMIGADEPVRTPRKIQLNLNLNPVEVEQLQKDFLASVMNQDQVSCDAHSNAVVLITDMNSSELHGNCLRLEAR